MPRGQNNARFSRDTQVQPPIDGWRFVTLWNCRKIGRRLPHKKKPSIVAIEGRLSSRVHVPLEPVFLDAAASCQFRDSLKHADHLGKVAKVFGCFCLEVNEEGCSGRFT